MTTTDWIIDIVLILIVLRQLRESRMDRRFWLIPLLLVGYTASHYLRSVPTSGHDVLLIAAFIAVGATLGLLGGLTTHVRGQAGEAYVRAGLTAASLWVGSMTARLGFIIWITHSGRASLADFSVRHHITGAGTWSDALVLMALAEVIVRIGLLVVRGRLAAEATRPAPKVLAGV